MNPTEKPPAGSSIPEIVPPRCPHCEQPLAQVSGYPYTLGNFAILCVYCPHHETCGKVLHFQIFQAPPAAEPEPGEPPKPKVWSPS
jgi:hypothetical protein